MANNNPNLYVPSGDLSSPRVIRDLIDRINYLTSELDTVRGMMMSASPGVDAARRENPQPGIVTIPSAGGYGRVIHRFMPATPVGTSGAALTTLHSYTLDPNVLATDGDFLQFWYSGDIAANNNAKELRPRIAGNNVHTAGLFPVSGGGFSYLIRYGRVSPTVVRESIHIMNNFMSISALATPGNAGGSGYFVGDHNDVTIANLGTTTTVFDFLAQGTANNDVTMGFVIIELYQQIDLNQGFIRVNPDGVIQSYTNPT